MADMLRPIPVDLEPKLINRFVLEFPTDIGVQSWMVQSTSRPSVSIGAVEIPYMNTSSWVAGRSVWDDWSITFLDVIGPSTSQKVIEWIRQCIEHSTGKMGYAVQYKKNIVLKLLDPAGIPVEKWTLYGCFITKADFGGLSYEDKVMEFSVTLKFDRAILEY